YCTSVYLVLCLQPTCSAHVPYTTLFRSEAGQDRESKCREDEAQDDQGHVRAGLDDHLVAEPVGTEGGQPQRQHPESVRDHLGDLPPEGREEGGAGSLHDAQCHSAEQSAGEVTDAAEDCCGEGLDTGEEARQEEDVLVEERPHGGGHAGHRS